ncbi:YibE/F family protein [Anaerovorax sp. IOR16]|uniref:YibE/F family protein n=1 Tax=Anaerovorax sp. IOR16 TaxID=2773458 RepID=UPI0019CFF0CA|nr:YibE/F family protein [Anaerovorax sp. IOR16]
MIKLLVLILISLLILIGGERGLITIISLCWNLFILAVSFVLMSWGLNPLLTTFCSCLLISNGTIFYQNGKNAKTIASFISVLIIMLLLFLFIYVAAYHSHVGGLNELMKNDDMIFCLSTNINVNMGSIGVSMIIIGLMGAIIDTAIAVSSGVYEVYSNNRHLTKKELIISGMSIGGDILGTTVNTLYFAYIGESLMLFVLFKNFHYTISEVINSKAFFQEVICIVFSAIGCVAIIPITAIVVSYLLTNSDRFKKFLDEDALFAEKKS